MKKSQPPKVIKDADPARFRKIGRGIMMRDGKFYQSVDKHHFQVGWTHEFNENDSAPFTDFLLKNEIPAEATFVESAVLSFTEKNCEADSPREMKLLVSSNGAVFDDDSLEIDIPALDMPKLVVVFAPAIYVGSGRGRTIRLALSDFFPFGGEVAITLYCAKYTPRDEDAKPREEV